jgi:ribosomal protein L37E
MAMTMCPKCGKKLLNSDTGKCVACGYKTPAKKAPAKKAPPFKKGG